MPISRGYVSKEVAAYPIQEVYSLIGLVWAVRRTSKALTEYCCSSNYGGSKSHSRGSWSPYWFYCMGSGLRWLDLILLRQLGHMWLSWWDLDLDLPRRIWRMWGCWSSRRIREQQRRRFSMEDYRKSLESGFGGLALRKLRPWAWREWWCGCTLWGLLDRYEFENWV